MKKRIICVLLVISALFLLGCDGNNTNAETSASTTTAESTTTSTTVPPEVLNVLNVMSLNIWGVNDMQHVVGQRNDVDCTSEARGPKLKALLEGEDIDIAGLQEVKPHWKSWIESNLKDSYALVGDITVDTQEGGYVIYKKDRFEVLENGMFWLDEGAPTRIPKRDFNTAFDRMCVWVVFKIKETGDIFLFMDTHLDWQTIETSTKQAEIINSQLPILKENVKTKYGVNDCPVILVGDMNANESTTTFKELTKNLKSSRRFSRGETVDGQYSTSPGLKYYSDESKIVKDSHVIDHVLVSNMAVLNYKMIHTASNLCPYGAYISDHNAVIANVRF